MTVHLSRPDGHIIIQAGAESDEVIGNPTIALKPVRHASIEDTTPASARPSAGQGVPGRAGPNYPDSGRALVDGAIAAPGNVARSAVPLPPRLLVRRLHVPGSRVAAPEQRASQLRAADGPNLQRTGHP